jgi:membrane protein implicated in regulation of membrane protease activity
MALRRPVAPTHQVDLLIGFTGFFAIMFFIITVVCELTGQPALAWALVLLVLVIVLALLWRRRRRILRIASESAADPRDNI